MTKIKRSTNSFTVSNSPGYLLDTNIFLWSLDEIEMLKKEVKKILIDPDNEIFVSVVSAWEISIKHKKGKLPLKPSLIELFKKSPFETLEIRLPHILELEKLPSHHQDPFDRLLVAQSRVEKLTLITSDPIIWKYKIDILKA